MTPLTKEQAIVISGFTGVALCHPIYLHQDIKKRMGNTSYESYSSNMRQIKELYHADFLALCYVDTPKEK